MLKGRIFHFGIKRSYLHFTHFGFKGNSAIWIPSVKLFH